MPISNKKVALSQDVLTDQGWSFLLFLAFLHFPPVLPLHVTTQIKVSRSS